MLLTLALLLALAPALGGSAKATNMQTLYIAGKTGAANGYEEPGYDRGNWVYDKGCTALSSGESVSYTNEYDNAATAAFTHSFDGSSTLVLNGYLTFNDAGYVNGSDLYGIYYDGSLTIQVYNECQLLAYRSGTFDKAYGIYVTGDLTIEMATGASLRVNMCSSPDTQISAESCGIYCGGDLTITGSGSVYAAGGAVTASQNRGYGRSAGVCVGQEGMFDNKVGWLSTLRSGTLSVGANAALTATGGNVTGWCSNLNYPSASFGVSAGTVTVDGTLTAKAGEAGYTTDQAGNGSAGLTSCGVWADIMTVGAGASASVTGGNARSQYVMAEQSSCGARLGTLNASGTLEAAAGQACAGSVGIYAPTVNLSDGAAVTATADATAAGGPYTPVPGSGSRGAEINQLVADGGSLTATACASAYDAASVGLKLGSCTLTNGATVRGIGGQGVNSLTVAGDQFPHRRDERQLRRLGRRFCAFRRRGLRARRSGRRDRILRVRYRCLGQKLRRVFCE